MDANDRNEIRFVDESHLSSLILSLADQRSTSKLCDVVLRVSDTEMFAHSNVLAAASPYFDTLFSGPDLPRSFSQKTPQIIDIHIDGENETGYGTAVQRVIDFMYTSKIKLENSILPQITEIANIMQMTSILGFCEAFKRREEEKLKRKHENDKSENVKDILYENEIPCRNFTEVSMVNADENQDPCQELVDMEEVGVKSGFLEKVKDGSLEKNNPETELLNGGLGNIFENKESYEENADFIVERVLDDKTGSITSQIVNKSEIDACSQICLMSEITQIPEKIVTKKKRGRPRKVIKESMNEEQEANKDSSKEDDIEAAQHVDLQTRVVPEKRVSRSGRVIKPRQFSDEIVTDIGLGMEIKSKTKRDFFDILDLEKSPIKEEYDYDLEEIEDPSFRSSSKCYKRDENGYCSSIQFRRFPCDKCDMQFSKIQDLHEHHRQHLHADKKCSYCGWVCENGNDEEFNTHLMSHNRKKTFFCNFCCVEFKSKTQLLLHLPRHLKIKPYVCSICNAGFKWKHALKNHLITHKGTKDYLCDICGFATAHKTILKSHSLIHTGETFKCPYQGCLYQATKKCNLNFHLFKHTGEKPHQCDICGTSFSLVKNMKRHMLLHQTERRYKCVHCSYCSTRFDKLKEHYFKQHNIGEKPNKKFTWANYLSQEKEQMSSVAKIGDEDTVLSLEETMETIELEVPVEENGLTTTQILNLTSSTGEAIPITITQIGHNVSYEIPAHLIAQEGDPDQ